MRECGESSKARAILPQELLFIMKTTAHGASNYCNKRGGPTKKPTASGAGVACASRSPKPPSSAVRMLGFTGRARRIRLPLGRRPTHGGVWYLPTLHVLEFLVADLAVAVGVSQTEKFVALRLRERLPRARDVVRPHPRRHRPGGCPHPAQAPHAHPRLPKASQPPWTSRCALRVGGRTSPAVVMRPRISSDVMKPLLSWSKSLKAFSSSVCVHGVGSGVSGFGAAARACEAAPCQGS